MTQPLSYIVFTDFDGTISRKDVGDAMFEYFGDISACNDSFASFLRGEITAQQCWREGCGSMRPLSRNEFLEFALGHTVDPAFSSFVDYCASRTIPVHIVSDGFDAYIDPILEREGLQHLSRFTNHLDIRDDGSVSPAFPHTDAECNRCANCKRNHLLTLSSDNNVIVYVGDGISDRCPVQYADIVFAKDSLVSFCETHNITFHRFGSFDDVLSKFRTIVETAKPKKRRTAELARKDIFMTE